MPAHPTCHSIHEAMGQHLKFKILNTVYWRNWREPNTAGRKVVYFTNESSDYKKCFQHNFEHICFLIKKAEKGGDQRL